MTKKLKTVPLPRSVTKLFPQVTHAADAKMPVIVSVEQKDCDDAEALNPTECALAKAAKRELHADGVIIGMSTSYLIKGDAAYRFQTPQSVQREIVSFDRHHDFAPGDYYLLPKAPAAKLGETRRRGRNGGVNKSAKRKIHKSARVRILPKGVGNE